MTEAPLTLSVERVERTEWITLQRTKQLNAMSMQMLREMADALENAIADDAVRAIVLTGSGRAFCAGPISKKWLVPAISRASRTCSTLSNIPLG